MNCTVLTMELDIHNWSGVFSQGVSCSFFFLFLPKSVAPSQQAHPWGVVGSCQLDQHGAFDEELNWWMLLRKVDAIEQELNWFPKIMSTKSCVLKIKNIVKWPDHHRTKNGSVFSIHSVVAWLPRIVKSVNNLNVFSIDSCVGWIPQESFLFQAINNENVFSIDSCVGQILRIWMREESSLFQAINLSNWNGSLSITGHWCLSYWFRSSQWLPRILSQGLHSCLQRNSSHAGK